MKAQQLTPGARIFWWAIAAAVVVSLAGGGAFGLFLVVMGSLLAAALVWGFGESAAIGQGAMSFADTQPLGRHHGGGLFGGGLFANDESLSSRLHGFDGSDDTLHISNGLGAGHDPYASSVSGPIVNIDGTPMMNDYIDIHGNPYGVTSDTFGSSFDSFGGSSDSFGSSWGSSSSSDSFGSSWGSSSSSGSFGSSWD
jgi:hypothetical protein